jgi:hypothetical protein
MCIQKGLASGLIGALVSVSFAEVRYRINGGAEQLPVYTTDANGVETATISLPVMVTSVNTLHIYDSVTRNSSTLPTASLPRLVIAGNASSEGRLNVLVADGDAGFPNSLVAAEQILPGLVDFGGDAVQTSNDLAYTSKVHDFDTYPYASDGINRLDFNNAVSIYDQDLNTPGYQIDPNLRGLIIPDPNLRRATVLAMSVSGDVCPEVSLAKDQQVWIDQGAGHTGRIEVGQVLVVRAPTAAFGD